jgi:hypothetical protein
MIFYIFNANVRDFEALEMPRMLYFLLQLKQVKVYKKNRCRIEEEICKKKCSSTSLL